MPTTKTWTGTAFSNLDEARQIKLATALAALCTPLVEVDEIRGLLEEADRFTVTFEGAKPIAFRVGDMACPKEEDPSTVEDNPTKPGGRRKRRSRGSRVKKQTRRTQRKRRNTVRR